MKHQFLCCQYQDQTVSLNTKTKQCRSFRFTGSSSLAGQFAISTVPSIASPAETVSNNDGTCLLSFTATVAVPHYLTVSFQNVVVAELSVMLLPGPVSPPNCSLVALSGQPVGRGSTLVWRAGLEYRFAVQLADVFGNTIMSSNSSSALRGSLTSSGGLQTLPGVVDPSAYR